MQLQSTSKSYVCSVSNCTHTTLHPMPNKENTYVTRSLGSRSSLSDSIVDVCFHSTSPLSMVIRAEAICLSRSVSHVAFSGTILLLVPGPFVLLPIVGKK